MVVDVGVVRKYIKPKADSTLYNMRKVDLIEYIRTLDHNYNVAVSFNENQAKYIESLGFKGGVVQQWIPVAERLPEKEGTYLTYTEKERIHLDCFCIYPNHGVKFWVGGNGVVTHWMPLPEPPKGE